MLLFPFYAVLIWYYAGKYRRSWKGGVVVLLGFLGFAALELLLIWAGLLGIAGLEPWDIVRLLIPAAIVVTAVAIFIVCLPRPAPGHVHCAACHYDLSGLEPHDLLCPECGAPWAVPSHCPTCRLPLAGLPPGQLRCPSCGDEVIPHPEPRLLPPLSPDQPPGGPDQQYHHRKPGDQHPFGRGKLSL